MGWENDGTDGSYDFRGGRVRLASRGSRERHGFSGQNGGKGTMAREEFIGQGEICLRAGTAGIVLEDRATVAGRFADADGTRDHRAVDLFREVIADFLDDLAVEIGAGVIHGHDDALQPDVRVGAGFADLPDDMDDFGQPFEAEPLALERDEDLVGGGEGGSHDHTERGRGVEDAVFEEVVGFEALQNAAQADEVVVGPREFDFHAGDIDVRRDEGEPVAAAGDDFLADVGGAGEDLVEAALAAGLDAEAAGAVGLGVEIDQQDALAADGEGGGEIEGGGGFPNPAFLVCDGNNFHVAHFGRAT